MKSLEIVEAVREEFPKFSKAALSLARRPDETGVTFVRRAAEIVERVHGRTGPHGATIAKRKKSISFFCRMAPAAAGRVKREITRRGTSQQALIEGLLLAWAEWSEKEPLTTWHVENGSKGEAVGTGFTSENITNFKGGQTND